MKTDDYVVAWRIWYSSDDGGYKEYNSVEHCFEHLPADGLQVMKLFCKNGERVISGHDYYFFQEHPKGIVFGQTSNKKDLEKYPGAIVVTGRHIPDGFFKEINDLMWASNSPLIR